MKKKRKNPPDLTGRNNRARKAAIADLERRVANLEGYINEFLHPYKLLMLRLGIAEGERAKNKRKRT